MKVLALLSILSCCAGGTRLVGQAAPTPAIASLEQSSCFLFNPLPKQINTDDNAVLLAAYNSQVHLIRSLHVVALVRGKSGKEYGIGDQSRELPAIIDFLKPNLLRMTGALSPTSSRGFEMTSDGNEFRLLVPEEGKKTFLTGPVDAPARSQHPRENLRPQPLFDALSWGEATLRAAVRTGPGNGTATQTLEVDLPPGRSGPITGKIEFDVRSGVVDSLSTYDSSGRLVSELTYRDWRMMSVYPDGTPTGCFPRRIHLVRRDGDYEIDLHITEIALNPQIPMSKFRSSPPRGIPIVHVDLLGNSAKP
jgi:outer membrane lipoprotein-sorting protein